jgi:hypothetical protein
MAWVTSFSGQSTVNKCSTSIIYAMFYLKELLKSVGWTVLESSDGSTYNSSGDQITHYSTGANGMNNNYSWFRIRDPSNLREYVFQRGTTSNSWKGLYSASDRFTGGTPGITTIPTATDQQGIFRASTDFQTMAPGTTCHWHVAAQSTPHNGVYAWWLGGVEVNTTAAAEIQTFICCDAIDEAFGVSGDNDPCVHYGSDDAPIHTIFCSPSLSTNPDSFRAWMRYGETDEEWQGITGLYYYWVGGSGPPAYSFSCSINNKYTLLPIFFYRHSSTGTILGFKGSLKHIRYNAMGSISYPIVYQQGSVNYLSFADLALPGWPDGVTPL